MPAPAQRPVDNVTFAERVLRSERPVLIRFRSHPCRRVTPVVERPAGEQAADLDVVKIDLDEQPEWAARHGVTAVPAFVVHAGGRPSGSRVGAAPQHILEQQPVSALREGDAR
ncbi:thioredoxin family protein [Nonomuraea diastatica]|uniref:Thiol reductase thioredoxin n=1 Tax=Nonomuraea diastatica TaxID=1848329 RepID=A0A4R4VNG5_9ACTN|nr:thioredoxin family protein [Nonomuraea diastatica]TDD06631.1 thiol reductase thioredoxin [Nonomuraea diastatica]